MVSAPRPLSRVFSKNFLRRLHDGTTQVSGWRETVEIKPSQQEDKALASAARSEKEKLGSEHNFVLA
jgi:hypothetical protein